MPVVLGLFLRQIVMAVASGAVVTTAQELLDGTFRTLVEEIKDTEGVTEQDAKDIVANILLDLAINSASIMFVLKTGAGVRVAEYLGLTSRNFGKAALTPKATEAVAKISADKGTTLAKRLFGRIGKLLAKGTGIFWLFAALTQIIEPLWYQPGQIQKVLQAVGIDVSVPGAGGTVAPGPFSADSSVTFSDFAKSIEAAGVKGIENPGAFRSELYTRDGLANLVNYVYGQELLNGRNLKVSDLLPLLSKYLVGTSSTIALPSPTTSVTTTPAIPKVYTGIVSQGVIGKGLSFTPRPDDLIESIEELKQAAANNLTPFLQTILGKIIYEVKIVPSIITKDGFKQTGTVQQIRSGTTAQGAPKYKTVVNKFATLNLYVMTDKGVRSKISTIVLGPTNSAKLTVGLNDIKEVETVLPSLVTTTDINEIKGIETAQAVTVSTPVSAGGAPIPVPSTSLMVTPSLSVSAPTPTIAVMGSNAQSLFDWYKSQGLSLPTVETRANIYEELGLGTKVYYTGTAEQNSKLLVALKQKEVADATTKARAAESEKNSNETKVKSTVSKTTTSKPTAKKVKSIVTTTDGYKVTSYTDGTKDRVLIKK